MSVLSSLCARAAAASVGWTLLIAFSALAAGSQTPAYTGETSWDPSRAEMTFKTSGAMPNTKEGFFWQVPAEVKSIVIQSNVTLNGGFRVGFRDPSNPLLIAGRDRKTSVIYGTDIPGWTTKNGIADMERWKYGSISVLEDAVVRVSNLTAENPRGYIISGYAPRSIIHVARCNLIDTRKGDNNNSDGFVGAAGSTICDSLISTSDDGIKIYHDMAIANVTIEQHRNGAPIQFGWGSENDSATASITNLTIIGVDTEGFYNMAPFTWEGGLNGTRTVNIEGLSVKVGGRVYIKETGGWEPACLFRLKPKASTLNMEIHAADVGGLPYGTRLTKGIVRINGYSLPTR